MGSDPRLGIPWPEGNAANDVPKDIKALVDKIGPIMAVDLQGTLAQRPAAGVRGRFYNATDDSLFRDDGTAWVRLTPGPWKNFPNSTAISRLQNGGGVTVTTTTFQWQATPVVRYCLLPGNRVEYEISGLGHLSGVQQFVGIEWTAPTAMLAGVGFPGRGDVFNDDARVVADTGVIAAYPYGGYNASEFARLMGQVGQSASTAYTNAHPGSWNVDNVDRAIRIHGFYSAQ